MPSVACQTEFAVDEATRLNETAIHIYLDILNILDDEPAPVIYDLGERAASQVLATPVSISVGSDDHPAFSPSSPKASQALPGDLLNESRDATQALTNHMDDKSLTELEEDDFRFENEMRSRLAEIRKGLRDPVESWLEDQSFGVWRSRNPSSGTGFSDDFKPNVSRLFFTNCLYESAFVPGATLCVEIEEEGDEKEEVGECEEKEESVSEEKAEELEGHEVEEVEGEDNQQKSSTSGESKADKLGDEVEDVPGGFDREEEDNQREIPTSEESKAEELNDKKEENEVENATEETETSELVSSDSLGPKDAPEG